MQQFIVIIIGIAVFGFALYKTYRTLQNTTDDSSGPSCGGCNSCSPMK